MTTGEVLLRNWRIEGSGRDCTFNVDAEWTFPLEFAELVSSDGSKVDHQIIRLPQMPPFSNHQFRIRFDATRKKWVRFAIWDSAGDGAVTQPVHLK